MKIGIIFHSKTGTTLGFGHLIGGTLREEGHQIELVDLQTDAPVNFGSVRSAPSFKVTNLPDGSKYDALLVGGPVWAFSACPALGNQSFFRFTGNLRRSQGAEKYQGQKSTTLCDHGIPLAGNGWKAGDCAAG